ncbi:response regulator [Caulobacter sp. UNC279MFTsu5.1]|uniref:response regulator n=1 Tax=Caulobacter sp. UNC279MFTsu5.1 TaxID=1502775 RepID=UPI0008F20485|nr:response regulator [Caulobacter sp. UNC279MFTsu5.1]SFK53365.1 Histidine kinase-, DNA gyrase B-, and HSP90-like ATPase [Caulobacter sp. UNC279MFTsu5.1]
MFEQTVDVTRLDGFVRYTRGIIRARLVLVALFAGLLAVYAPMRMTQFGLVELSIYAALFLATEAALRHPDPIGAFRRLRWQSIGLVFLLSANACALAVKIRLTGQPIMRVEAALLAICVLLFAALRVHTSKLSYVTAVAPPVATLLWIGFDRRMSLASNHYGATVLLFVVAVLTATWRQQATDRALAQTLRDLARKNADLIEAVAEAKAASRAKSDLLAVASHEIRTPLNAVLGFAHALRRDTFLTPIQADLAQGVIEGGAQLTRLLDTVLDLTKVQAGQATLTLAAVDLRRLIRTVVRVWSAHAQAVGVLLSFDDADPGLAYEVLADEAKLEQTLVNLVSNGLKASPSGGTVTVRLAGMIKDRMQTTLVEVRDTGAPVPLEDRPRMFVAFDQTERGRSLGGSGLGLSICAANLALMGGEIGVENFPEGDAQPGKPSRRGAVFWFAFEAPVLQAPAAGAAAEPAVARPIRVLAAEDNPANRRVLAALLSASPVELVFAENGARALDAWRAEAFDLVLMDVNMPVMDGVAAVARIRQLEASAAPPRPRTPIWMLTANVFDDDVARYRADGADGVLRKPIDTPALFALLAQVAEGKVGVDPVMSPAL